jgi:2-amino-4-hydroxy-6-hydroxymethyldihydropteridine diphosphokinase
MRHHPKITDLFYTFAYMFTYYLHLGTNQGDRLANLGLAHKRIGELIGAITAVSSVYETEPWGLKDQDHFLNQAVSCTSSLSPDLVLAHAKSIEAEAGPSKIEHWGPRVLDIDVLYADGIVSQGPPILPHPQIAKRNFVLIPMMEIAPDLIDPIYHKSIEELYDECEDPCEVFLYESE